MSAYLVEKKRLDDLDQTLTLRFVVSKLIAISMVCRSIIAILGERKTDVFEGAIQFILEYLGIVLRADHEYPCFEVVGNGSFESALRISTLSSKSMSMTT
jgi:hypothetical protein